MHSITLDTTVARRTAPSRRVTGWNESSDFMWALLGIGLGALSGALTGLAGIVIWSVVHPSPAGTFVGLPLILGAVVAPVWGGLSIRLVGGASPAGPDVPSTGA